jgi:hypothetical protein
MEEEVVAGKDNGQGVRESDENEGRKRMGAVIQAVTGDIDME